MNRKTLHKKINKRKHLLNFLLIFFKRSNPLIISLSQNLDYFIQKEQNFRYSNHTRQANNSKVEKIA
ncbi:MAG: hypothetical protein ACRCWG_07565 [Sarcina sp.]